MNEEQAERLIELVGDIAVYLYNINRLLAKSMNLEGLVPPKGEVTEQ